MAFRWSFVLACLASAISVASGICDTAGGWTADGANTNCFIVKKDSNASWAEARQWCVTKGGELASILTINQNVFVRQLMINAPASQMPAWIGFSDSQVENSYQWSDGSAVQYTHWRSGEPNNLVDEDCVNIDITGLWNDADCSLKLPFVCKKPFSAPIPVIVPPNKVVLNNGTTECGSWFKYNNYCYQYFSTATTWDSAQSSCFSQGGYLLDILSTDELNFGKSLVYQQRKYIKTFYIGLNDRLKEGTYVWSDGTVSGHPLTNATLWSRGEPNDYRHQEDCVEWVQYPSNKWNDIKCSAKLPYVCKRKTSPTGKWTPISKPALTQCPSGFITWTHPVNKGIYCYRAQGKIAQWRSTWYGARSSCRKIGDGFDLVSIHDHYEMNAVVNVVNKAYSTFRTRVYWIGLNDISHEGGYIYSDGTPTDYINWGYGQPNNLRGTQDCTQIYTSRGQWNDDRCNSRQAYICKFVLKKPIIKGGTPTVTDKYCASPWYQYKSYCYLFKVTPSDYVDHGHALGNCTQMKSNLTSIQSLDEHAFLVSLLGLKNASRRVHIGINDIKREGEFQWTDNTPVTFTNWGYNEPNNWRRSEDCAELDPTTGYWNDISCTRVKQRGYICKKLRDQPQKGNTQQANCKTGWQWYNNYCYMAVITQNTSFSGAESNCQLYLNAHGLKGHLATIRSRFDNFFVLSMTAQIKPMPRKFWIGLSDIAQEGVYTWSSGLPITFAKWAGKQPDDYKHAEDCVEFRTWSAQWNDQTCATIQPYICMIPDETQAAYPPTSSPTKGNPQASCPVGWAKHNTYCYGLFGSINALNVNMQSPIIAPMMWVDARAQCISMGANLVSIHNQDVQTFLLTEVVNITRTGWFSFWTGLNDRNQEGGYLWSDGTGLGFTNWATQEPNDYHGSEDCVENLLDKSRTGWKFKWNDQSCSSRRPFVCALPAGNPYTKPTASPYVLPPGKMMYSCPTGWTQSPGSCYKIFDKAKLSWSNADLKCRALGQLINTPVPVHLASIHSPGDHIALAKALASRPKPTNGTWHGYWVGLSDQAKENHFNWSDGSPTDYLAWGQWQPDNHLKREDCGAILYNQGYVWNDGLCATSLPYICGFVRIVNSSSTAPTTPSPYSKLSCGPGWTKWGLSCYQTFNFPKADWPNAFMNCSLNQGDLVVIDSKAEDQFIDSIMITGSSYYWLGLSDIDRENYWRWVNGNRISFSNWGPGQPNNQQGTEDCVAVHSEDDKWYDRDCSEPHPFICEVPVINMQGTGSTNPPAGPTAGPSGASHSGGGGGGNVATIVGAIVGVLLGIVIIAVVIFVVRKRSRGSVSRSSRSYMPAPMVSGGKDDEDDDALLGEE